MRNTSTGRCHGIFWGVMERVMECQGKWFSKISGHPVTLEKTGKPGNGTFWTKKLGNEIFGLKKTGNQLF